MEHFQKHWRVWAVKRVWYLQTQYPCSNVMLLRFIHLLRCKYCWARRDAKSLNSWYCNSRINLKQIQWYSKWNQQEKHVRRALIYATDTHISSSGSFFRAFLAIHWKASSTLNPSFAEVSKYGIFPLEAHQAFAFFSETCWAKNSYEHEQWRNTRIYLETALKKVQ